MESITLQLPVAYETESTNLCLHMENKTSLLL